MKVYFEKTIMPCVVDDVIAWHVSHGWVWDVVAYYDNTNRHGPILQSDLRQGCRGDEAERGSVPTYTTEGTTTSAPRDCPRRKAKRLGVFFCTLLCGDGVIVHFSTVPGVEIPWHVTLAAFRKAVRMVADAVNVVFATIPADNIPLLRCACRLGFRISRGSFFRDGSKIRLLQYFPPVKNYIKGKTSDEESSTSKRKV